METEYYNHLHNNASMKHQSEMNVAIQCEEMNLFALLKPSIKIDGNQWCVLYGDNLQDGIAGFGSTPMLAIYDFNKAWYQSLPNSLQQ